MGYSAGAGAAAAVSGEIQPTRMMLIAPSGDAGPNRIMAGLKHYSGRLCMFIGDDDEIVGRDAGALFDDLSPSAHPKEVIFVPGCDHFFSSEEHDRLYAATVVRVFSEDVDLLPDARKSSELQVARQNLRSQS